MYLLLIYKQVSRKGQDNKTMKNLIIQIYKKNFPQPSRNHAKNVAGFTLVESLVAISILMIAIASPMYLAQKSLSSATLSKDQMIATFLAQDAIEAVRNIRDQIAVSSSGGDWLTGQTPTGLLYPCICNPISQACNFDYLSLNPVYCQIDTTNNSIKPGMFPADKLNITKDGVTGNFLKYDYEDTVNPSKFSRYINIIKNPANSGNQNEAEVNVRVTWSSPLGDEKIDLQDFIYNYSENF